jgi:putative AlgH/UPF0301 family transcriptional regulator
VVGNLFNETVILLLRYDEYGAIGVVVKRPTDVQKEEILSVARNVLLQTARRPLCSHVR